MEINPTRPFHNQMRQPIHQFQALISGVEGDVLFFLAHLRETEIPSEIARKTGRSKAQVQQVLNRFHNLGLIERFYYGRWSWNRLNDDHPFTEHIKAMAREKFEASDLPGAIHALDAIDE